MGNSHSSKFRQSNIELLRILATLGVIILHYNNPSIGGGIAYTQGASRIMLFAFEALNICAVNLFVLISGYFLSRSQERDLLKPVKLVVPVIIYSVVYYLYRVLVEGKEFSLRHFIRICIPTNWYVILYVALFLISPYINVVLDYLKKNHALRRFILIVVCTFSVYPMLVDILQEISGTELMGLSTIGMYGSQYGFTIVNFVVLYILGAALNGYKVEKKTSTLVLLLFIDEVVIFLWAYGEFLIADRIPNGTAQEYCNPLIIAEAVLLFVIFSRFNIQSRIINVLAGASFTVYLIHGYFIKRVGIEKFASESPLVVVLHLIVSTVCIYLIGWGVDNIYKILMKPFWKFVNRKWMKHRTYQV